MGGLATDPAIDVIAATAFTWAAHSSVAVVLLIMSLTAKGVVPLTAALALVIGANIGSAINPVLVDGI
jgi:phosphate:Na+ symporter